MKKTLYVLITSLCFAFVAAVPAFSAVSHRVKSGDNLYTIAKKYHVSVDKLKNTNNLKSQGLKPGQKIVIEQDRKARDSAKGNRKMRSAPEAVVSEEGDNDGEFLQYRIRRGDTVDKVALKFGVEKQDIVESNNSLGRRLSPGRILLIPKISEPEAGEEVVDFSGGTMKPWKTTEEKYMLVKVAKSFMGAPYQYGGNTVRGLDCSAFVKKIYEIFDVQLPRSARDQYKTGPKVSRDQLAVGDLVFFRTKRFAKYPTHVGIYIGDGNFIHSSSGHGRIGVKVDSLQTDFYNRTFIGATRVKKSAEENSELTRLPEIPLSSAFNS